MHMFKFFLMAIFTQQQNIPSLLIPFLYYALFQIFNTTK